VLDITAYYFMTVCYGGLYVKWYQSLMCI